MPCGRFYVETLENFSNYQAERLGIDASIARKMVDAIDLVCTNFKDGFNRERFPRSFSAASVALDISLGQQPDAHAANRSFEIGNAVFDAPYDLYPGVREMLEGYRHSGYNLFLYTKGDHSVQQDKIDRNQLLDIFAEEDIFIVGKKSGEILSSYLNRFDLEYSETVVIGDSLRDDVGSAIDLGLASVWVSGNHQSKWAYESVERVPTFSINSILDLPRIIPIKVLA